MASPTVVVEAGFTVATVGTTLILDDAARGKVDTATLAGEVWTDITTYVNNIQVKRGASRADGPVLRYEAGTMTIQLDNSDRRFDPTNLSGPYVGAGVTQVTPMRSVRVTATWAGENFEIFRGFADSWDIEWQGYGYSQCTLQATDATKVMNNFDRVALGVGVGAGEDSGARVNRILDSVSWPTWDRIISAGDSTLQATTMDRSAWEELLNTQDSEIGEVYVDAGGRVVFRNRNANATDPRSGSVQAVYGDAAGELPFQTASISYDDTTILNLVRIARVGGTQQIAQDATSQSQYLVHTHDRTDLMLETDTAALDYANFILAQAKDPELRFTSLSLQGHDDEGALFPQMLGSRFGDRITINRRPPGGGTISRDSFIRGVSHSIVEGEWTTTFTLQSASKWGAFILDSPTLGVLDTNVLAF